MATRTGKRWEISPTGHPSKPIYTRTSVLCNGQIAWKVGRDQDMTYTKDDPERAELRPIGDVTEDLNALNGLQIHRTKPLTPLELKQPLRHVHSSLPNAVKARIYTGDLYGSTGGVFSCSDKAFTTKVGDVFGDEVRRDGGLKSKSFFRRLRSSEWLLWDVEAAKGHWVAVIAHLYKKTDRDPCWGLFSEDSDEQVTAKSTDFNRIDEWCVATARRSPEGDAMVERVKRRLPKVLKEGGFKLDKDSEIDPAIWVPMDESNWSSGIRVYALIKALMYRVAELYCKGLPHQPSFWGPLPGWLNVDEVRAEMQGRAAQRCMAATGYRSRIAIEGVRKWLGVKEPIAANRLKPPKKDSQAYRTGEVGADGRCILVDSSMPTRTGDDDKGKTGLSSGPPSGQPTRRGDDHTTVTDTFQHLAVAGAEKSFAIPGVEFEKEAAWYASRVPNKGTFGGPIGPPPSHVHGWEDESTDDSSPYKHVPLTKLAKLTDQERARFLSRQHKRERGTFGGPVGPPPDHVSGWDGESTDDSDPFRHVPLTKLKQLAALKAAENAKDNPIDPAKTVDGKDMAGKRSQTGQVVEAKRKRGTKQEKSARKRRATEVAAERWLKDTKKKTRGGIIRERS
ncbi:hypothetical protein SAMD00023353_0303680 [Rosellinia necatrix]|uniref:Ubiquitin-like protease family profile domain-containing protein n=1 Tax=Rosellinia necatrix TaxID=77044 RepID=A0A1S8A590_ROSNE|nr:hypothetical protein SAMD00023353_0303680 [Rosellinia necatrix]